MSKFIDILCFPNFVSKSTSDSDRKTKEYHTCWKDSVLLWLNARFYTIIHLSRGYQFWDILDHYDRYLLHIVLAYIGIENVNLSGILVRFYF